MTVTFVRALESLDGHWSNAMIVGSTLVPLNLRLALTANGPDRHFVNAVGNRENAGAESVSRNDEMVRMKQIVFRDCVCRELVVLRVLVHH